MDAKQIGMIVVALLLLLVAGTWLPVFTSWMQTTLGG